MNGRTVSGSATRMWRTKREFVTRSRVSDSPCKTVTLPHRSPLKRSTVRLVGIPVAFLVVTNKKFESGYWWSVLSLRERESDPGRPLYEGVVHGILRTPFLLQYSQAYLA